MIFTVCFFSQNMSVLHEGPWFRIASFQVCRHLPLRHHLSSSSLVDWWITSAGLQDDGNRGWLAASSSTTRIALIGATGVKGKNNTMVPSFVPQCVQFAASQGLTVRDVSMPELEVGKKFLTSNEWGSIVDSILKR